MFLQNVVKVGSAVYQVILTMQLLDERSQSEGTEARTSPLISEDQVTSSSTSGDTVLVDSDMADKKSNGAGQPGSKNDNLVVAAPVKTLFRGLFPGNSASSKVSPSKMAARKDTNDVPTDNQRLIDWPWRQQPTTVEKIEAAKDPRVREANRKMTMNEISNHHNERPQPSLADMRERKSSSPRFSNSSNGTPRTNGTPRRNGGDRLPKRPATPPARRVQFLLGSEDAGSGHVTHPLFAEMEELFCDEDGKLEWKETARWIKFEEDVEDGGDRWSKPHVATLSLHSLFELRSLLTNGVVCLDMEANSLDDICDLLLDHMVNLEVLDYEKRMLVKDAILKRHRHQYESHSKKPEMSLIRSLTEGSLLHSSSAKSFRGGLNQSHSTCGTFMNGHGNASTNSFAGSTASHNSAKLNTHFMKKIPKDAEASNILVGELKCLEKPVSAFIRLYTAIPLGDLTEVPLPTRFIFILLGPPGSECNISNMTRYHEIGRSMATVFSDDVFHDVAYKAKSPNDLLTGLDEFLGSVTVLPPGEWDPSIRIEPPPTVPSQDSRKNPNHRPPNQMGEEDIQQKERKNSGLVYTGRPFGGLINDIKRKKPFYKSDFVDGFSMQCVASIIFMYFACLAPAVTFGGLLGEETENHISVIEALVGGMVVGVAYGFFSGQPLSILGPTGPILVFETIVYDMCTTFDWNYLSFRFCIGIWVGIILMICVATDASVFVCYITRFTEENFALLIAVIFIKSSIEKLADIGADFPIHKSECFCLPTNSTDADLYGNISLFEAGNKSIGQNKYTCSFLTLDTQSWVEGIQSPGCHYSPNTFLASVILFVGTYLISTCLKNFKSANFFPSWVRSIVSDFAVVIALVCMTGFDYMLDVGTPKLLVPSTFSPTLEGRSWLVNPIGTNPWWTSVFAAIPALLATILVFMDQQITVVIVNRKEHLLKKGCGYHLDLCVVAIMIVFCSMFGMPWCEASTVPAINHVKSLTKESESSAPGEKTRFLGIREQRVTHIVVFILIGLSVFMAPMLTYIPMPVLFGIFLYMGVTSCNGLQLFDRILLFFMPKKYQPDLTYLRRVPLYRVHMFTMVQMTCLIGLWIIKDIQYTSILFPIMLIVMVGVRKLLDFVFTKMELKILDDILPSFKRSERLDDEDKKSIMSADTDASGHLRVTMANGNVMTIPLSTEEEHEEVEGLTKTDSNINITEELIKTGVWKSLPGNGKKPHRSRRHQAKKRRKRMIIIEEEETQNIEPEDNGIEMVAKPTTRDDQQV